jgi:3-hydroxy-9,10-secoandrosta-1,3,5(10)-triene-9,17-dione monooxygenase reductase component
MSSTGSTITALELREALGHLPTGVTVVTSLDAEGGPVGTTVSAVCSLSADPALVLVCLKRDSETLRAIHAHGGFAVNVLADDQDVVSSNFARSGEDATWDGVDHVPMGTGLPQLQGALAVLDCAVHEVYGGGDHEIVIGRVGEAHVAAEGARPLVHWRGRYARIQER